MQEIMQGGKKNDHLNRALILSVKSDISKQNPKCKIKGGGGGNPRRKLISILLPLEIISMQFEIDDVISLMKIVVVLNYRGHFSLSEKGEMISE